MRPNAGGSFCLHASRFDDLLGRWMHWTVRRLTSPALLASFLILSSVSLFATDPPPVPIPVTGTPAFGSYGGGPFDVVNLGNLNTHFTVPIFAKAGLGGGFTYNMSYDGLVWAPVTTNGAMTWAPMPNFGWKALTEIAVGYLTSDQHTGNCTDDNNHLHNGVTFYGNFVYHDPIGNWHPFSHVSYNICDGIIGPPLASDGSGYYLTSPFSLYDRSGRVLHVPSVNSLQAGTGIGSLTDPNGNQISTPDGVHFTDASGNTVVTATGGTNGSDLVFTYTAPNNQNASVTVSYSGNSVQTNFLVPGVGEYGPTLQYLISRITLPDGSFYRFDYETTVGNGINGKTTGRLARVILPRGGWIQYSYAGDCPGNESNCMMTDGSPSVMTRTMTQDGGSWVYTRALQPNQQLPQTTTTVLDPAGNQTTLNFSGIYETKRVAYQGTSTILDQSYDCYNGHFSNCQTAVVAAPISYKAFYDLGNGIYGVTEHAYNAYGLETNEVTHDYASNSPVIRYVNITYNHYNQQQQCTDVSFICDRVKSVQIQDGSHTQAALTNYAYDGTGNLQTASNWVTGNSYLTTSYTHNTNGTISTATDPKGTPTSYSYALSSCGNTFPTSISVGALPPTQYAYNCTGGVLTSVTDPNGAVTAVSYTSPQADPYFWRPSSSTDTLGNITYFNYFGVRNAPTSAVTVPRQTEVVGSWSGSTLDLLSTPDAYNRPWMQQRLDPTQQFPWDTVQEFYLPTGAISCVGHPFATSAGPGGASTGGIPATCYNYDAVGRLTQQKDCNGSDCNADQVSYSYNLNDVTVTKGPGQQFTSELEFDGLGRVTSVCEASSSLPGVTPCGQNMPTGYKTSYTYDALGDLKSVTQGAQARSLSYDHLGRMTSESNAETGTTTYLFDSVGANYCAVATAYTSSGDLVAKADAKGNHTCYVYDDLHRLTDVGNNRQSATNLCHRYRYDNSLGVKGTIPAGISPQNPMGRMVEAATDNCSATGDPLVTDEWFSYSKRGDATDLWSSMTNSGWYHLQEGYFPNGAISSLQGFKGTGATSPFSDLFTYSLDTLGRPYGMADAGTTVWRSTTYNPASQPTAVTQATGGGETFRYETYANRLAQWQSTAGSQSQTGTLSWNANGTLQQVVIADPFNTTRNETCTNGYDDLARLSSNSCSGTGWSQSFVYDRYGNIDISGSSPFQPTYNPATNHITTSGFSYDANGNLTGNTSGENFTYDTENRPVQVQNPAGTTTTWFDAFDRAVEVDSPAAHTQLVYAPDGTKFAYMNGQTLQKFLVPMVAGMQAVYNGNGTQYFAHVDWLGSSRLGVKGDGTVAYDRFYSAFGQPYVELNNDGTNRSFTGQTQDTTSSVYDFEFRQESPTEGRWLTPDPAGLAAVDPTNPQSWNRYAYVANDPLNAIDPLGLKLCWTDASTGQTLCDGGGVGWSGSFGGVNGAVVPGSAPGLSSGLWSWVNLGSNSGPDGQWVDDWELESAGYSISVNVRAFTNCEPGALGCFNVPTQEQAQKLRYQACLNQINNTPDGKVYNFFSPLSMIPGFGPDSKESAIEDVGFGGGKYLAFKYFQAASKVMAGTPFGSMSGFVADTTEAVAEGVGLPLMLAATGGQLAVHVGCALASGPEPIGAPADPILP